MFIKINFIEKKDMLTGQLNINSHKVLYLLPSHEIENVAQWLSSFPNLEVVSRDVSAAPSKSKRGDYLVRFAERPH